MMKVMLIPVKLLAIPVMLLLLILCLLGRAATHISAYVVGPFLLMLVIIDLYCLWQQRWTDVAIVTVWAVLVLVLQFGAVLAAEIAGEWSGSIRRFIFS